MDFLGHCRKPVRIEAESKSQRLTSYTLSGLVLGSRLSVWQHRSGPTKWTHFLVHGVRYAEPAPKWTHFWCCRPWRVLGFDADSAVAERKMIRTFIEGVVLRRVTHQPPQAAPKKQYGVGERACARACHGPGREPAGVDELGC